MVERILAAVERGKALIRLSTSFSPRPGSGDFESESMYAQSGEHGDDELSHVYLRNHPTVNRVEVSRPRKTNRWRVKIEGLESAVPLLRALEKRLRESGYSTNSDHKTWAAGVRILKDGERVGELVHVVESASTNISLVGRHIVPLIKIIFGRKQQALPLGLKLLRRTKS